MLTIVSLLVLLHAAPRAVGESSNHTRSDVLASNETFVPDPQAAADFNAKAIAAGLMRPAPVARPANGSMAVATQQAAMPNWGWYVYSHLEMGFSGFDYANQAYSPETQANKKLYLCSVSDDANSVRALGVATFQSNSPWPSRCVVPARSRAGALSVRSYGVQFGLGPAIVINPQATQIYAWWDAMQNQNLWKCGDDVGPPPHKFTCPFVPGNYPEAFVSPFPIRRFCRFQLPGTTTWVYGWTDARYQQGLKANICYAVTNPAGAMSAVRAVSSTTYQILGLRSDFTNFQTRDGPRLEACAKYRMNPNWPQQYWPGMAGNDMVEGAFNLASSFAACALQCQTTPGCVGVTYTARFGWCWLKPSRRFGDQKLNNQWVGNVELPLPPPDPQMKQCPRPVPSIPYLYATFLQSSQMAPMSTGSCRIQGSLFPGRDWGHCGIKLAVYADSLAKCCDAVRVYNTGKPQSEWSYAFSWKRGYNQCFLRGGPAGRPASDCTNSGGWDEKQAISARVVVASIG